MVAMHARSDHGNARTGGLGTGARTAVYLPSSKHNALIAFHCVRPSPPPTPPARCGWSTTQQHRATALPTPLAPPGARGSVAHASSLLSNTDPHPVFVVYAPGAAKHRANAQPSPMPSPTAGLQNGRCCVASPCFSSFYYFLLLLRRDRNPFLLPFGVGLGGASPSL